MDWWQGPHVRCLGGQEVSSRIESQAWTLPPFLPHLPSEALCYCLAPKLLPPVFQLPKRRLLVGLRASGPQDWEPHLTTCQGPCASDLVGFENLGRCAGGSLGEGLRRPQCMWHKGLGAKKPGSP